MTSRFPAAKNMKVEELIKQYDQIIPDVEEELKSAGMTMRLPRPAAPDDVEAVIVFLDGGDPVCPDDLTAHTDIIVRKLFSYFSNYANYVESEISRAKNYVIILDRQRKVVHAALKAYYRQEKQVALADADDHVVTDTRFVQIDTACLQISVYAKQAESRLSQLKRTLNLLSREQTARSDELERLRQEDASKGRRPERPERTWQRRPGQRPSGEEHEEETPE
jgi:hypothetical protein